MRIALVTPFAWSQPHDVNEHAAGVAGELRRLGHDVTILAPSNRARDLREGRRALQRRELGDLVAVGPAVPISRRSAMGVPLGVRANVAQALSEGEFDVVHGLEPGLPSISNLALRDATCLTVASFFSPDRLGYPPGKAQRQKLLARIDALVAGSEGAAQAAAERFPGDFRIISEGVDPELFAPTAKRKVVVAEWRTGERPVAKAVVRALAELADWELVLVRTKPFAGSPYIPRSLAGRVHLRTARDGTSRAALLRDAAIFVPAPGGLRRLRLEAEAAGCALADPSGIDEQPELAAAATLRLAGDAAERERLGTQARTDAESQSFAAVAAQLDTVYRSLGARRRPKHARNNALAERDLILVDLHMHTSWSHDCQVGVEDLLDHAESIGLGAIAVTDHNVFGGALEAVELARDRKLVVIPGEEVKTDNQGEVIGLFLKEQIPRGLSFADTIAAIRAQNGIVYLPHPFDRMHAIPESATIHRHLADIDVFEAYNARLLWEGFNVEAERFARKYGLTVGAGSDAHVLQGVGTGALRMRRFEGPEEFLLSLRHAEVVKRPRSLVYLQSLKWVATVKEKAVKEKTR